MIAQPPEPHHLTGPHRLSGLELKRLVRAATRAHSDHHVRRLLEEVYVAAVTLVILAAMLMAGLHALSTDTLNAQGPNAVGLGASTPPGMNEVPVAAEAVVVILATSLLVAGVIALAWLLRRLGPVNASQARIQWLLSTPVDRRGLMGARRWALLSITVAVAMLLAALGAALLAPVFPGSALPWLHAAAVVMPAALVLLFTTVVAQSQAGRRGRWFTSVGIAVSTMWLLLNTWILIRRMPGGLAQSMTRADGAEGSSQGTIGTVSTGAEQWVMLGIALIGCITAVVLIAVRVPVLIDRIATASFLRGGQVGAAAGGAISDLNLRALMDTLSSLPTLIRSRSRSMVAVRGPYTAVVVADLLNTTRSRRHIVQWAATAVLAALATVAGLSQPVLIIVVVVAGYLAALAAAQGSRLADNTPAWEALLPLSEKSVRRLHSVVPVVSSILWWSLVWGFMVVPHGFAGGGSIVPEVGMLVAVAISTGVIFGSSALRSAFRPAPDWSAPLIVTPLGMFPQTLVTNAIRGFDTAILGSFVVIAVMWGYLSAMIAWIAVALAILAWGIATHVSTQNSQESQTPRYASNADGTGT